MKTWYRNRSAAAIHQDRGTPAPFFREFLKSGGFITGEYFDQNISEGFTGSCGFRMKKYEVRQKIDPACRSFGDGHAGEKNSCIH